MDDVFSRRLREARLRRGSLPEEIGLSVHKSASTVLAYERGDRKPDPQTLALLCGALRVSADWLLGLTDAEPNWDAPVASDSNEEGAPSRERRDIIEPVVAEPVSRVPREGDAAVEDRSARPSAPAPSPQHRRAGAGPRTGGAH